MCRLLLTIAAVVAIAQLSLQASLPNEEHLRYSFHNFNPESDQKLDIVKISDSTQSNLATRTLPVTTFNTPSLAFTNWPNYVTSQVNLTETNYVDSEICMNFPTFCCRFEMYWQNLAIAANSQHYFYRFGVFQGYNNVTTTPPTICSVFRCATNNLNDCDRIITVNTNVVFDNITITANITRVNEDKYTLEPFSFNNNLQAFPAINYQWLEHSENEFYGVRYILNTVSTNLYAFSINGTGNGTYPGDIDDGSDGGAAGLAVSMFIMLSVLLFAFIA